MIDSSSFININKDFFLSYDDNKIIDLLYQPLIGMTSVSIYKTIYYFDYIKVKDLIDILNISITNFNKQYSKLEAIGLIETYVDSENNIYINIIKPYSSMNFFHDGLLSIYLKEEVGYELYDKLFVMFNNKKDFSTLKDISKKFSDVFSNSVTVNNDLITEEDKRILIENSRFSFDIFIDIVKKYNGINIDDNFKNQIINLAYVYNINEEKMSQFTFNIIKKGNVFNYDNLRKELELYYKLVNETTITLKEKDINNLIKIFEKYNPGQIVEHLLKRKPTSKELSVILDFISNNQLENAYANALVMYVVKKLDKIPTINYFNKVFSSWKNEGIDDFYKAYEFIIKEKNYKLNNSTDTKLKDNYNNKYYNKYKKNNIKNDDNKLDFIDGYLEMLLGDNNDTNDNKNEDEN